MPSDSPFHKQSALHYATKTAYDRQIDRYWTQWRKAVNCDSPDADRLRDLIDSLYTRRFAAVQFGMCRLTQIYLLHHDAIPF